MAGFHSFQTRAIRGSRTPGVNSGPLVTPLVQSTTFLQERLGAPVEHAYSRVSNPTVCALEKLLGDLEETPAAVCFSTGIAAEAALFSATLSPGDHVVCGRGVYGGTVRLLQRIFGPWGVDVDFVDTTDLADIEKHVRPATRLIFIETPSNPALELTDIAAVAKIARRVDATLIVDNTFLTPALQRPLELGADVCVYSTTKLIEGHSVALGGAVVSRDEALLDQVRFIRKCTGAIQTPFNAWLTIQGVKTLPIRIAAQSERAQRLANWLAEQPQVARVNYPGLGNDAERQLAQSQHLGAHGNVLSFELVGGGPAARRLLSNLSLCSLVEHVGSVETLVTHSASMTHADVPVDQRLAAGITDGLIRISVGLEDLGEILHDVQTAIEAADVEITEEAPTVVRKGVDKCVPAL